MCTGGMPPSGQIRSPETSNPWYVLSEYKIISVPFFFLQLFSSFWINFLESRKRKVKNWEEDDFYDSDEDTFLDRTGSVEKKRQQRMKQAGKGDDQVETYQSLVSI